ncbi:C-type lectin domain family 7 member A-like [Calypte anna]|uniref:C-type lectin domain family 7 member A-like n=1 Tax=Calypte anna TaxID=9244 RepID=UPI0011C362FD|nr:C-type lectin domain family 7 member A-like [Calypte anna]
MSENLIYADLNLTESGRPGLQKVIDVQGSTYTEVKVKSLDTNAGPCCHTDTIDIKDSRRGKSCCSRTCVTALVAVVILLLVLAVCLVFLYHPTTSSPPDSKPLSTTCEEALKRGTDYSLMPVQRSQEAGECLGITSHPVTMMDQVSQVQLPLAQDWEKNGRKCYFFSPKQELKTWNDSRKECIAKGSDLVIIDNEEELAYLKSRSMGSYYFLGLTYSKEKWKWTNGTEHNPDMFQIESIYSDYFCTVIGHDKVQTASCNGSSTTINMCEKAAVSEGQKELKTRDPASNVIARFL